MSGGGTTRTPAETLARLRAGTINLPGIGYGSPLVLGLGAAQIAADQLGLSLKQVGVIGGVAGAALLAVSVAFDVVNKNAAKAAEAIRASAAAYAAAAEASATSTNAQLQARKQLLQQLEPIQQELARAANQAVVDFSIANPASVEGPLKNLFGGGEFTGLTQAADAANTRLAATRAELQGLDRVLADMSPTIGTANEALRKLTQAQIENAQRDFEITQMTADKRAERIAEAQQEIAFLQQRIYNENLTADASEQLSIRIGELKLDIEAVAEVTDTYADALEREKAAKQLVTDSYDQYFLALDLEAAAREQLIEISRQLAELEEETAERRAQAAEDRVERITDIEADAADRRTTIIADGLERINKIQRDAGRKQLSAIGLRDALALYEARLHAQDQLDDQKEQQEKQLKSVNDALEKQRRNIERQYEKQQESINRAYQKQQERLNAAYQVQEVALNNAIAAQELIALNGVNGQTVIHTQLWTDLNSIAVTWAANTVNTLRSIFGVIGGSGGVLPGNAIPPGGVPNFGSQSTFNRMFDNRFADYRRAAQGT